MRLLAAATNDQGKRLYNEDRFLLGEQGEARYFAIAHGMGGSASGEPAAELAIAAIKEAFSAPSDEPLTERPTAALTLANDRIFARAAAAAKSVEKARATPRGIKTADPDDIRWCGMCATAVAACFAGAHAAIAHVGLSRAYRFFQGELEQLTEDHSLEAEALRNCGEIPPDIPKNILVRALGVTEVVDIDAIMVSAVPGDVFLLCSAGLSNLVPQHEMAELLSEHGASPERATRLLVDRARLRGEPIEDIFLTTNITAIVIAIT